MIYRVILTRNGEYKATLHKCVTRETSFSNFRKILAENETVLFEKKFINYKGIKPVTYMVHIVKDREETDTGEQIFEWTLLDSHLFKLEEEFSIYGFDNKTDRKIFTDVVKILMDDISNPSIIKEIVVVHNKLLIYNEDSFDMIICKCKKDAQRLHHTLYYATEKMKLKNRIFMGTCTSETIGFLYDLIHERTGWNYTKIRRTTTRP